MTSTLPNTTGEPDLAAVIQTYNEVTERLKVSHELLRREVCRLREELHQKNKELQRRERLAALGEMAAGVAHEIRNPLGGIGLYASLLERDLKDRPGHPIGAGCFLLVSSRRRWSRRCRARGSWMRMST